MVKPLSFPMNPKYGRMRGAINKLGIIQNMKIKKL